MINASRATMLFALLATSATVAWAETSVSPVPLIVAKEGSVVYVDRDGPRVLADCLQTTDSRMLGGPDRGKIVRESEPCRFTSLAVHPATGRWAVSANVRGDTDIPNNRLVSFVLAGRQLSVPTNKAGRAKGGNFIVMGDLNGIVAITPGLLETWNNEERFFPQSPDKFTEDGSRVLVSIGDSTMVEWWSWSFGPRPESVRVLPRGTTDTASNMLVSGERRTVLRHPRSGVRVATLDPTGKKPWKVGPPLKQVRKGMLTPVVLGDTMLFYREGDNQTDCVGVDAGTYLRLDLSTGQERVWRRHEGKCTTHDSFDVASPLTRKLYFVEGFEHYTEVHLYEYDLDRDTTREIAIEAVSRVSDISADGRTLLVRTYHGLVLYDVVTDSSTLVEGLGELWDAKLLAQP